MAQNQFRYAQHRWHHSQCGVHSEWQNLHWPLRRLWYRIGLHWRRRRYELACHAVDARTQTRVPNREAAHCQGWRQGHRQVGRSTCGLESPENRPPWTGAAQHADGRDPIFGGRSQSGRFLELQCDAQQVCRESGSGRACDQDQSEAV